MKAVIRAILDENSNDLSEYSPADPQTFGIAVRLLIGPQDSKGEESFDVFVCTPSWFYEAYSPDTVLLARHHVIVTEYNYERLVNFFNTYVRRFEADSWEQLAEKLAQLGRWEFEDYRPSP